MGTRTQPVPTDIDLNVEIPSEIKTHREFYPYYAAGWCDRLIAERFYYSYFTVFSWRRRYRLKAHSPKPMPYYNAEEMKSLYDTGLTDFQIAKRLHCWTASVYRWRKNHGNLPSNSKPRTYMHPRFRELYDAGKNDVEISDLCGRCPQAVYSWRKKNHLPTKYNRNAHRRRKRKLLKEERREHYDR